MCHTSAVNLCLSGDKSILLDSLSDDCVAVDEESRDRTPLAEIFIVDLMVLFGDNRVESQRRRFAQLLQLVIPQFPVWGVSENCERHKDCRENQPDQPCLRRNLCRRFHVRFERNSRAWFSRSLRGRF
jgi:hypothetical protein